MRAWVVPGSEAVKRQAEAEGLDRVFTEAGFAWREPGCSMCLAANGETIPAGQRSVSTSNRNFVGRQGPGARTHLASPAMAAAAYYRALCHFQGWPQSDADRETAVKLAWRAVELVPNDAQALWMAAFSIWNMSDERGPVSELFSRSLTINPNSAMALTLGGWIEM